ncbi:GntR family transcriptional regulator / MocR family aminotransferase [Roseomonas rosea]|uniref:GntR family transcriptional regulator / MocR family aminotransferase n=1 Tax=Muricoccus roseus TaxID=198092 RepID=A0A1M6AYM9_9PROT|nr:PLP-dependent aminotransferase family protein [Roseomonas rosea]SHI41614.1 GntR family transcriptional regulator / MocR family aminotransferase [Roseomonas rosea]
MASDDVPRRRITHRIGETIKGQIASGLLAPGARLPSTRSLAVEWGVSRTTVTAAYEQLIAEGYLETRQGAPTQVARGLPPAAGRPDQTGPAACPDRLSAHGQRLREFVLPPTPDTGPLLADFRYGDLAAGDFPMLAWRKAAGAALLRRKARLRYEEPSGSSGLRAALQGYLWRARGLRCDAGQIIVVNGSQQGLDLCARLLIDPGERAVMEDPGYNLARQVLLAAGAEIVPVPVDEEGMRTDGLPLARLAYVTPSHQFPLGSVMSAARRRELLAWARHGGAYVIEDDYDSEYRFDIAPVPPLQALDQAARVIYLGTVSKTLSPTLRLGYLVVPPALSSTFAKAKRLADRQTPSLEQEALAGLIEGGAYERHVRRARRRNGERRAALLAALSARLGDAVTVVGADAGLHVVAWLNRVPRAREDALVARALAAGIGVYPIGPLYAPAPDIAPPETAGLVMGYASLDEQAIDRGVRKLAEALEAFCVEGDEGRR